jgi:hypothetical protein
MHLISPSSTKPDEIADVQLFAAKQHERRSQVRGSLMLAAAVLAFAVVRAIAHDGLHRVFSVGWWRIW